jgi:hypothetical protein
MTRREALGLVALAALVVAACEDGSTPVEPVWGKQACASCTMLVSDPRFAAQASTHEGARVHFDDPGCLAAWLHDHADTAQHAWVRGAAGTWIDARTARYTAGQRSPMGYGFAVAEAGEAAWSDVEAEAARRSQPGRSHP